MVTIKNQPMHAGYQHYTKCIHVTIVEIHMMIIDVCVSQQGIITFF